MPTELNEGLLTANRIAELYEQPINGRFDVNHLREVHRRIFQDLPHHGPGEFRPDAPGHVKTRGLESTRFRYPVAYALRPEVDDRLENVLGALQGGTALRDLPLDQFTTRMAKLYGDLDHLHPFREGNSRTLRSFTAQLAETSGHKLDWGTSNANPVTRDNLYMARDFAVIQRTYPGIATKDPATFQDRSEYSAFLALGELQKADRLVEIIRQSVDRGRSVPGAPMSLSLDDARSQLERLLPAARHQALWDEERARILALRTPGLAPLHEEAVRRHQWIEGPQGPERLAAQAAAAGASGIVVTLQPGERAIERVLALSQGIAALDRDHHPLPSPSRALSPRARDR